MSISGVSWWNVEENLRDDMEWTLPVHAFIMYIHECMHRKIDRRYLYSHVRSQILRVDVNEMALASYLPVAQFQGAT